MKPNETPLKAFDTSEGTPTIAFEQPEETLALPYDSLDSIQFDNAGCIRIFFQGHEVSLHGSNLLKLFEALAAFRVKEIQINGGNAAQALGAQSGICLVDRIEIKPVEAKRAA